MKDGITPMNEYKVRLYALLDAGKRLVDDQTATLAPEIYDGMRYDGSLIPGGSRINWKGVLKKAAVDLWDREENDPDNAPGLWEALPYREGIRLIPEVITVTAAFSEGEQGWWQGSLYRSKVDANVYTPAQYPEGWEKEE